MAKPTLRVEYDPISPDPLKISLKVYDLIRRQHPDKEGNFSRKSLDAATNFALRLFNKSDFTLHNIIEVARDYEVQVKSKEYPKPKFTSGDLLTDLNGVFMPMVLDIVYADRRQYFLIQLTANIYDNIVLTPIVLGIDEFDNNDNWQKVGNIYDLANIKKHKKKLPKKDKK